jgi:hypothetical protein
MIPLTPFDERVAARRANRAAVAAMAALAVACGCAAAAPRGLVGAWKSDSARTLESMRATPDIPDDTRRRLEADYYGHS